MHHVLWLGGPPGSGKTTVATWLARRYGLRLYSADTRTWEHRDRALVVANAAAQRWESLSVHDRWEQRTDDDLLEMSLHRERGDMVIADLRSLPASPLIIAEGSSLPAAAVSSGIAERSRAVWLLPTDDFQVAQLIARGTTGGPLRLYRLLNKFIEREARDHGVPTLAVDGTRLSDIGAVVEDLFGLALSAGPVAETLEERHRLLREINEAIVVQVRGYHARPWANGDPNRVTRSFVCECGQRMCELNIERTVGEAATGPLLAAAHTA